MSSLSQLFSQPDLSPVILFSNKSIASQLKNNLALFINYSLRHKSFIYQCFKIALNSTYQELQSKKLENVAYCINEVLACDEDQIFTLFFQAKSRKNSDGTDIIEEEIGESIQTEAERLFGGDDQPQVIQQVELAPIQIAKNQLAEKSFEILKSPIVNQSSLGYLSKIWSFLIRCDPNLILQFFSTTPQCFQLLLSNLKYYSISNIIAQLLVSQDKKHEYKYQQFKKIIFVRVIHGLIDGKQDQELYFGTMILIEEVLNNSKQTYYQHFQDFKRQVAYLVTQSVLSNFLNIILQNKQSSLRNVLCYLQLVFERINNQKEQNDYYNNSNAKSQPSMDFQINKFFQKYLDLVKIVQSINQYSSLTRIQYLSFLQQILKTSQSDQNKQKLKLGQVLTILTASFKNEKTKGIYKVKLYKLIQLVIKKCSIHDLQSLVNKQQDFFYSQFFTTIKLMNFQIQKNYNRNQSIAFQCKLLFQIDTKLQNSNLIENVSKLNQKNIKRIKKNYQTKIANFGKVNKSSQMQQGSFFNFNQNFQTIKTNSSNSQSNLVGKNNISIPILNIPQQTKKNKQNSQRKHQSQRKLQSQRKQQSQRITQQNNQTLQYNNQTLQQNNRSMENDIKNDGNFVVQKIQVIRINNSFQSHQITLSKIQIPKINLSDFPEKLNIPEKTSTKQKVSITNTNINTVQRVKFFVRHIFISV